MPRTVAVVGGGVAGLVAARVLSGMGRHVLLLEAAGRPGGALAAGPIGGVTVDLGAEAYGVTRGETADLIAELGLDDRVTAPRRSDARLLLPDGLFAMPPGLLGIPTDLRAYDLRAVLGEGAAEHAARLDSQPVGDQDPTVSLGALVRSRMGDAVVERILVPVVAGVHAANPDAVEAEAVVPGILAALRSAGSLSAAASRMRAAAGVPGAAIAGLDGGMTTLVNALVDDATARGVQVRCGAPVRRVHRDATGWRVESDDAAIDVDDLVLAVDAPTAAALVVDVPSVAAALSEVSVGGVALVALAVRSATLDDDPVGSGVLVGPGHPQVQAKAMTHATAKWEWIRRAYGPGHHLVRLSYGRDGEIDAPIDDLPAIASSDAVAITGAADLEVVESRIVSWERSLVRPTPGHRDRVARIRSAAAAVPNLAVIGAGLGGNGLAGTIAAARSVDELLDS